MNKWRADSTGNNSSSQIWHFQVCFIQRERLGLTELPGSIAGVFSLLFLITFSSLANQWSQSPEPVGHYGVTNVGSAIAFSFFSIFIWVSRVDQADNGHRELISPLLQ